MIIKQSRNGSTVIGQPPSFINFSHFEGCRNHSSGIMPTGCWYPIFHSSCMNYQVGERWVSSCFESSAKEFGMRQESTCGETEEKRRKGNAYYAQEKFIK